MSSIATATVIGAPAFSSADSEPDLFAAFDAVDPPHDPETLCQLFEHSNSLRRAVDAYTTNIDAFGHRLECTINFEAESTESEICKAMRLEALAEGNASARPTRRAVLGRRKKLEAVAEAERAYLDAFLESCCFNHSFVELRRRTRQDLEVDLPQLGGRPGRAP